VFEEGYLRPDCITIENGGVNQHSEMPRDLAEYPSDTDGPELVPVGTTYRYMASFACCYSILLTFLWWLYPGYRHHKRLNAFYEAFAGVRSFLRWLRYSLTERAALRRLEHRWLGKFFLVALQVHDDFQIKNSRFEDVAEFIREVVRSFAEHAPKDQRLVFKHHPLDRGYRDYGPLLRALAHTHGLGNRLLYVHDLHLPTLLRCARGCVVLNSTVGLSSLFHGTPVKVLDSAVYDIAGLAFQAPLDDFWSAEVEVDAVAYHRVRAFMLRENQGNGSFYRRLAAAGASGVFWPPGFRVPSAARAVVSPECPVVEPDSAGAHPLSISDVVPSSQGQLGS
jgi:capsule polysaccharide modification protein KpsS